MTLSSLLAGQSSNPSSAAEQEIVTWSGNTPEWNQRLGVTLMRMGCNLEPGACLQRLRDAAKTQQVTRWAIAISGDAAKVAMDALEYSERSLAEEWLVQIDIDDFVDTMKSWHLGTVGGANQVLATVIRNVKRSNPRLRFGITLYEDELDSLILAAILPGTRARVDRVSLYLHYRSNAMLYRRYVAEVQQLFPRAAIWAGSYAYDRIDYLPCAESGARSCSVDEEIELYRESLRIQLALLSEGTVSGIEFYPGFFGLEEQWSGWSQSRICRAGRIHGCLESTRQMRDIAETALEEHR
jgi:hypothetical protein